MRIFALCTVSAGADLLRALKGHLPLAGLIGLTERASSDAISGYVFMRPVADEMGIPFIGVDDYTLKSDEDRRRLEGLECDLLLVCGWQRLVPSWLIEKRKYGVVGSHGSPQGISGGRGRSPQNWALILGARNFSISIFFIDPGIDAGPVIATRTFPLSDEDDIASSYAKATLLTADMIARAFADGSLAAGRASPQESSAYYLPQRLPEDGGIDWNRGVSDIRRFVSALSRPYPGAFSWVGDTKVTIWKARPFNFGAALNEDWKPGKIALATADGHLIVAAQDGLLLIDDFDVDHQSRGMIRNGVTLSSSDFGAQMRTIVSRHQTRFPQLPLAPDILRAAGIVG